MLVNFILNVWLDDLFVEVWISVIEEEVELTAHTLGILQFLLFEVELVPVHQDGLVFFPHVVVEVLSDFIVDTVDNSKCLLEIVDNIEFGTSDIFDLDLGVRWKSPTLSLINKSFVLILLLLDDGQISLGNRFSLFLKELFDAD